MTTLTKQQALDKIEELKKYVSEQGKKETETKKWNMEIKNRYTGSIIFQSEKTTIKEAVTEAVENGADLHEANLRGADLYGADLHEANLRGADLYGADLYGADLYEANLHEANLSEANLHEANLRGADLQEANLRGADLSEADLHEANLSGAELQNAKFYGRTNNPKILKKDQVPIFLTALGFKIDNE